MVLYLADTAEEPPEHGGSLNLDVAQGGSMNYACDREGFTCVVKVDASIHYEASELYTASTHTDP